MKKRSLWLARFESRNFEFEGCGESESGARAALDRALRAHCRARAARLADFFFPDDVQVRELISGQALIDGTPVESMRVIA